MRQQACHESPCERYKLVDREKEELNIVPDSSSCNGKHVEGPLPLPRRDIGQKRNVRGKIRG